MVAHEAFAQTLEEPISTVNGAPSRPSAQLVRPEDARPGAARLGGARHDGSTHGGAVLGGDRYVARQTLGEGGFGIVVRAMDRTIGRDVAVKTLLRDDPSERRQFLDEACLVGNLDHPNVVPVHDVGVDADGRPFFVMKLVEGDTLDEIVTRLRAGDPKTHAQFCFETRLGIFERLLDALAHAHAHGIVHRDVKPSNVMVGRHGEVYLLDWGIAARVGERPGAVGTPMYMAPEQARAEPADVGADVYGACLLLYELLSLHHPFDDCATVEQVILAVQGRPVPLASDQPNAHQPRVPMDLSWFVAKGLEKDPSRRYGTVEDMRARLRDRRLGKIPVQCGQTLVKRGMFEVLRVFERHPLLPTIALVGTLVALFAVVVLARVP
jgi:serine/threonine protein kinase